MSSNWSRFQDDLRALKKSDQQFILTAAQLNEHTVRSGKVTTTGIQRPARKAQAAPFHKVTCFFECLIRRRGRTSQYRADWASNSRVLKGFDR